MFPLVQTNSEEVKPAIKISTKFHMTKEHQKLNIFYLKSIPHNYTVTLKRGITQKLRIKIDPRVTRRALHTRVLPLKSEFFGVLP